MTEPLSAERLEEIRQRTMNGPGVYPAGTDMQMVFDRHRLLAEVDRQRDELAEAKINAAAEIHEEGHRLIAHDRNATLHQLLTFIERKYGRDNLAASWKE